MADCRIGRDVVRAGYHDASRDFGGLRADHRQTGGAAKRPIGPGDGSRLTGLVKDAVDAGRLVPSLSLDSLGGTFGAGVELAQIVRTFGLSTYVEDGAQCASACLFAAGKQKFASY